jgi:hypothetical protein
MLPILQAWTFHACFFLAPQRLVASDLGAEFSARSSDCIGPSGEQAIAASIAATISENGCSMAIAPNSKWALTTRTELNVNAA